MEEQRLNEKKELIYSFLCDKAYHPMKFKEIAGFLQVPKEERNDLRLILLSLVEEGKVVEDEFGRYRETNSNLKCGLFSGTMHGFGFVIVEGEEGNDIFISEDDTKGARDQDKVQVSLKDTKYSQGRTGRRREGVVVAILERGNEDLVGTFVCNRSDDKGLTRRTSVYGYVRPDNQKFDGVINVSREHTKGAVGGHKVVVHITKFGNEHEDAEGRIIEILGHVDDPGVDILSVIRSNSLPVEFPEDVLRMTEQVPTEVLEDDFAGRLDIRNELTVTIDGEDAKDLDDAVTISRTETGYRLGVHIADVSHYVTERSALDKEAYKRGTSCYLVDRVIPMLPHTLSNGICSLNAGKNRLALSCIMELDEKGTVISHQIEETVICVNRRMSYTKVQQLIEYAQDGKLDEEEQKNYGSKYTELFLLMKELSDILRQKRKKRGSLDFDLPESKIVLREDGTVTSVQAYERNKATMIIEDFMLIANETVAEEYYWSELPFLYRSHDNPDEERIQKLSIFINNFGYSIHQSNDEIHPKELQKLLSKIADTPEEALISRLTLRSMKRAKYTPTCDGHFGLAAKYYCHFTSPIRRYPDLQIHRIIKENIHGKLNEKRIQHYESILPEVAVATSRTERRAEEAERETEKMKKAQYMTAFIGETFDGVISGVSSFGIYVELPNTIEGMIRVSNLFDDYYVFDETRYRMVGETTKKEYKLGQKLKIIVDSVDTVLHTIDFLPVDLGKEQYGKGVKRKC